MAKSSNKSSDYQKYLASLKHRGYENLPRPDHEETIDELIAEGGRLLELDELNKKKTQSAAPPPPTPAPKKVVSSENPYLKARKMVLKEYGEEKAKMILKMEADKDIDNGIYTCFYQRVTELGDKLSNT